MKLNIIENSEERIAVALNGELDSNTTPKFEEDFNSIIKGEKKEIIFDFSHLEYISSAGMRAILRINNLGNVIIKGMNEDIRQIFQMTGFDSMLNIVPDERH